MSSLLRDYTILMCAHVHVYVYICALWDGCVFMYVHLGVHVCTSVYVCSVSPLSHHLLVKMKVCISLRYEMSFSWRRDLIG